MSSKNNHIHDEIGALLSESENLSHILEYVDILSIYKPKITINRTFQKNLRIKLLTQKNAKKNSYFSSNSLFLFVKALSIAAACFILTFGYFDIFFPKTIEPKIRKAQKESIPITPPSISESISEKIPPQDIQKIRKEKDAIDKEMSSIIDDINSIKIVPTDVSEGDTTSSVPAAKMQASPYASDNANTTPTDAPASTRMSPMFMAIPEFQIPEYAPSMNIYIKSGSWTDEEIASQSGISVVIRVMPTERLSIIRKKTDSLLAGRTLSGAAIITYQIHRRIVIEPENPSYLIPVIEYPLLGGEKISIPLIRGFR